MEKVCRQCENKFTIENFDLKFYEKISVPSPPLCPDCRQQRRLVFRNERCLYHRKCDLTKKSIISLYSPDKKNKVYDTREWWGDKWDAKEFGRDFNFSRSFFEQFKELLDDVPEISLMNDDGRTSENCAYTNDFAYSKNCYLCFVTWHNEDCYYSTGIHYSKDMVDSLDTMNSELCYECVDSDRCYQCVYLQYCENCVDCYFGYDLRNCKNCFKCVGLQDKQFYIENKAYTKEGYEKKILKDFFLCYLNLKKAKEEYFEFLSHVPHRNVFNVNCENCLGNKLRNCKNVWGFESYECFDCRYIYHCPPLKDCFDLTNTGKAELCYETLVSNDAYKSLFTNECWNTNESFYCNHCFNCDNLFGCSGLKKQKYCIFNKQYSKDEYEKLVTKIVEHMKKTSEWGEFFPMEISPFCYNETTAQEYFPLKKEEVLKMGLKWYEDESEKMYKGPKYEIPDNTKDVPEDICNKILICEETKKPFKIIPQELKFYQKLKLPIPRICHEQRHKNRMKLRVPRKFI